MTHHSSLAPTGTSEINVPEKAYCQATGCKSNCSGSLMARIESPTNIYTIYYTLAAILYNTPLSPFTLSVHSLFSLFEKTRNENGSLCFGSILYNVYKIVFPPSGHKNVMEKQPGENAWQLTHAPLSRLWLLLWPHSVPPPPPPPKKKKKKKNGFTSYLLGGKDFFFLGGGNDCALSSFSVKTHCNCSSCIQLDSVCIRVCVQ